MAKVVCKEEDHHITKKNAVNIKAVFSVLEREFNYNYDISRS